jgi:hypothetical protein
LLSVFLGRGTVVLANERDAVPRADWEPVPRQPPIKILWGIEFHGGGYVFLRSAFRPACDELDVTGIARVEILW